MYPERVPDKLILTEDAHASPLKRRATQANASAKAVHRTALVRAMQSYVCQLHCWWRVLCCLDRSRSFNAGSNQLYAKTGTRFATLQYAGVKCLVVWIWVGLHAVRAIVIQYKTIAGSVAGEERQQPCSRRLYRAQCLAGPALLWPSYQRQAAHPGHLW